MYRAALRAAPARIISPRTSLNAPTRRFISTAPTKRRSWKSSAFRIALVAGGVYYYNTSNVFAEEPEQAIQRLDDSIHAIQESDENTIDAIIEEKKQRRLQQAAEEQAKERSARAALENAEAPEAEEGDGLDGLEEEAGQQGAFNPETGEINWDCPCLGGMANGPCGEQFKAAFSCFVYSKEEPKGMECIEKFKGMQDCFREHPDVYASELEDDEDEVEEELRAREAAASEKSQPAATKDSEMSAESPPKESKKPASSSKSHVEEQDKQAAGAQRESQNATVSDIKKKEDKESELLPKASHDAK